MKELKVKNERAITLIALVITIIVLLILAGVTIATLTGENGILTQAQQAKQSYEKATNLEEIKLRIAENKVNGNNSASAISDIFEEALGTLGENPSEEDIKKLIEDLNSKSSEIGESTKIIEISTEEEMRNIGKVDAYPIDDAVYILMNDIALNGEWIPIGSQETPFAGAFNGMNKIISGLSINATEDNTGLFGVNKGKITKITIKGTSIESTGIHVGSIAGMNYGQIDSCNNEVAISSYGNNDGSRVGGIVGENQSSGKISNCNNVAEVYGKYKLVGGICGYSFGTIENSTNSGNIVGDAQDDARQGQVGGIVGDSEGSESSQAYVINCINKGNVTASGLSIGGIAGTNFKYSTIKDSYNSGKVSGEKYVGGITGNNHAIVEKCYNTEIISSVPTAQEDIILGGICGYNGGNISQCYNTDTAEAKAENNKFVGGIVGSTAKIETNSYWDGSVDKCYNNGKVTGKSYIGGVAGRTSTNATLNSCYNEGSVNANTYVGGISGDLMSTGTIKNCYNKGEVLIASTSTSTSSLYLGGIVGVGRGRIMNCYNSGVLPENESSKYIGGIAGRIITNSTDNQLSECYYLDSTATSGVGYAISGLDGIHSVSSTELKELATTLGDEYINNEDDEGYPKLKWQS